MDEYITKYGPLANLETALNELAIKGFEFVNVNYCNLEGLRFVLIMKRQAN